jgi:hypothetical protein
VELVDTLAGLARTAAGVAALPPPPEPTRPLDPVPGQRCGNSLVPHPSQDGPHRPPPRPRNQVPAWRWARPWLLATLVGGVLLGSALGAGARQLSQTADPATGAPAVPGPTPSATVRARPAVLTEAHTTPTRRRSATGATAAGQRTAATRTGGTAAGRSAGHRGGPERGPAPRNTCRSSSQRVFGFPVVVKSCHGGHPSLQLIEADRGPAS